MNDAEDIQTTDVLAEMVSSVVARVERGRQSPRAALNQIAEITYCGRRGTLHGVAGGLR